MNLNERVKSLFGDTSARPIFTYVDGINCIQLSNFGGFDRLYVSYMEKDDQPMGFSIDGYSKFFQRFMNASLEITVLADKHAEEFEIVKQFFNAVTSIEPWEKK